MAALARKIVRENGFGSLIDIRAKHSHDLDLDEHRGSDLLVTETFDSRLIGEV